MVFGYAMQKLKEAGYTNLKGITMSDEDVKATQGKGFDCENMDLPVIYDI